MDSKFPTSKELKKLADACRKAGITSFKGGGIEITFSDNPAPTATRRRRAASAPQETPAAEGPFKSDTLSEEELLFWSIGGNQIVDPTGAQ